MGWRGRFNDRVLGWPLIYLNDLNKLSQELEESLRGVSVRDELVRIEFQFHKAAIEDLIKSFTIRELHEPPRLPKIKFEARYSCW